MRKQFALPVVRCISAVLLSAMPWIVMISSSVALAESPKSESGFRFKEIDEKSLGLWEGDKPVLVYNQGKRTLPGVAKSGIRSTYVHPIYGLDGEVLTDDFPKDHYHHHGLFWGWPHVKIGAHEYDLWKMVGIRIDFERWLAREANADRAKLGVENGWYIGDKRVMKEAVELNIQPATEEGRSIDVALTWTPTDEPITLGGAEGKSYGGVTLRFAPRTDTVVTVPTGPATEDLLEAKLPWADLSAKFAGAPSTSGAAVFAANTNLGYPPEWMTRAYGLLAPGWPGVKPQTLEVGKPVTCRYRVWLHRGTPEAARIQAAYDAYTAEK